MSDQTDVISLNVRDFLNSIDPGNRLLSYYKILSKENKKSNLVSRETLAPARDAFGKDRPFAGLEKLTAESLFPITKINRHNIQQYLDIGSGGGFPAVPIMLTNDIQQATLVERTKKKAAALRRIVISLDLQAEIIDNTFEDHKLPSRSFDLITIRLVKLTSLMLKRIIRLLSPEGTVIYYARPSFQPDMDKVNFHSVDYCFNDGPVHCATFFYGNQTNP